MQATEGGRRGAGKDSAVVTHREITSQQQQRCGLHQRWALLIYSDLFNLLFLKKQNKKTIENQPLAVRLWQILHCCSSHEGQAFQRQQVAVDEFKDVYNRRFCIGDETSFFYWAFFIVWCLWRHLKPMTRAIIKARRTHHSLDGITMEIRCGCNIWNIYSECENKESVWSQLFGEHVLTKGLYTVLSNQSVISHSFIIHYYCWKIKLKKRTNLALSPGYNTNNQIKMGV